MTNCEIIKEQVSMSDLLEKYEIYKQRNNYICPFHNDKNPSAGVDKNGWFHCFACGVNYNVINFVKNYEKCDIKTAIAKINNMFGLGLNYNLTKQQKQELHIAKVKREKEKARNEKLKRFEKETCDKIIKELRLLEQVETDIHPTRGEIRTDTWKYCDLFFYSLKRQEWLNWLYDAVCGFDHPESEFDYTIGTDKVRLLREIYKGELEI